MPYKKRKRIPKSKVEDEANLQKKRKRIPVQGRSRNEPTKKEQVQGRSLSQSLTKKNNNFLRPNTKVRVRTEARDPKSKPTERT